MYTLGSDPAQVLWPHDVAPTRTLLPLPFLHVNGPPLSPWKYNDTISVEKTNLKSKMNIVRALDTTVYIFKFVRKGNSHLLYF